MFRLFISLFSNFKLLFIPCWRYVYYLSKNNYILKAYMFFWKMLHVSCLCCSNNCSNLFLLFVTMILSERHCQALLVNTLLSDHQEAAQLCWNTFRSVSMCKHIFLHEPNDSIWKLYHLIPYLQSMKIKITQVIWTFTFGRTD